jgi:hypothetical protein
MRIKEITVARFMASCVSDFHPGEDAEFWLEALAKATHNVPHLMQYCCMIAFEPTHHHAKKGVSPAQSASKTPFIYFFS